MRKCMSACFRRGAGQASRCAPHARHSWRNRRLAGGEAGFTLLEMMVAVAVLAAMASIIPRSFVAARANFDRSEDWLKARLVAEAVLAEELAGNTLRPGVLSGSIDGRAWSASLGPNFTLSSRSPEIGRILLDVRVKVAVEGGESLEISTMRIGQPE
jgi:prepilin-type N-terminal cleavage/methylation domain-containing protein